MKLEDVLSKLEVHDDFLPPVIDADADSVCIPEELVNIMRQPTERDREISLIKLCQDEHNRWIGERALARITDAREQLAAVQLEEEKSFDRRVDAFVAELTALSEKHGIWCAGYDEGLFFTEDRERGEWELREGAA